MKPKSIRRFLGAQNTSLALVTTITAFAAGSAFATDYTWKGTTDSTWATITNWTPATLAGVAPTGTVSTPLTASHRLNINNAAASKAVYTAAFGTTTYANTATSGRGLVIGSGTGGSGTLEITGGTFSTFGSNGGDVIANSDNNTGRLIINGGNFIGTNAGTGVGIGGGLNRTGILDVLAGNATCATLDMNTNSATINLDGGTLAVNKITNTGNTGILNLNGGTLQARKNDTTFVTGLSAVNVKSGGAVIDSNGFNVTISNILRTDTVSLGGGLTKNGGGTLTLPGDSTYTGPTIVNGGLLDLTGTATASSAFTVNGGRLNIPSVSVGAANITLANGASLGGEPTTTGAVTFAGTNNLYFDPSTAGALTANTVNATGATITVNLTAAAAPTSGIVVIDAPGGITGGTYLYTGRGSVYLNPGNTQLLFDYTPASLTWKGNDPTNPTFWDVNTTTNWLNGASPDKFIAGDVVSFDDSATSTNVVVQGASLTSGAMTFNNTTKTYTLSGGSIGGGASLTKTGSNSLTVSNANTFGGGTTLNAGTLNINNASALGVVASGLKINGGVIDNTSGLAITTNSHPLDLNADFTFTGSNELNLGAGASSLGSTDTSTARTITTTAGKLTLGGIIADGAGGTTELIKAGNGALALGGSNTFTGAVTINAGTVVAQKSLAFGANTGGVTVASGATIDLGGNLAADALNLGSEMLTVSGTGVGAAGALVNNSAPSQINAVQQVTLAADTSFGGSGRWDMRGTGNTLDLGGFKLTKTGAGYIALVGTTINNPGSGGIEVTQGTLGIQTGASLSGGDTYVVTVRNGATLENYQTTGTQDWSLVLDAGATFWGEAGTGVQNTWSGPVTLGGAVTLRADGVTTISGIISGVTGAVTKTGGSTLTLTNQNTYGGGTTVSNGVLLLNSATGPAILGNVAVTGNVAGGQRGYLKFGAADQLQPTAIVNMSVTGGAGANFADLTLNGTTQTIAGVTAAIDPLNGGNIFIGNRSSGDTAAGAGVLTINNSSLVTIGGGATTNAVTIRDGGNTLAADNGTLALVKNGAGTLALNLKSATYTGGFTLKNGTLQVAGTAFAATTPLTLEGGTLSSGDTTARAFPVGNTVSLAGDVTLGDAINNGALTFSGPVTLTGNRQVTAASDATFSAAIGDGGSAYSLTKAGAGKLTLSGVNTYTGATSITGGTLALDATGTIATSSGVTIGAGAKLETTAKTSYAIPAGQPVTFKLDGSGAGSSGQINAAGLDITTATVVFNVVSALDDATYVLATYGVGTLTGSAFASVTVPSGYALDYAYNGGTQIALVQSATSPYDTWINGYPTVTGGDKLPTADPDKDGLVNQQEFAFGLVPNSGASVNPVTTQLNKTTGQFIYQRLATSALTYTIWTSTDLVNWSLDAAATASQAATPTSPNQSVTVTLTGAPLTAGKLFVRVKAE